MKQKKTATHRDIRHSMVKGLAVVAGTLAIALGAISAYAQDPVQDILALEADAEYGQYLSGECLTCHQDGATNNGVPPISHLPPEYFVFLLLSYQDGRRDNEVMGAIAKGLGNEEIAALAKYFSSQQ